MDRLSILLVEDDTAACRRFNNYISTLDNVLLVDFTNSSVQALAHISHYKPDVVILDLELHNGAGNGLDVLTGLASTNYKPFVVVTTNNCSDVTHEYARNQGADFIYTKTQQGYSEQNVIDFIVSMKNVIKRNSVCVVDKQEDTPEIQSTRLLQLISIELDLIGINRRSVGFKYLVDGIYMTIDGPIPKLCEQIAKKYNKSEASVERAMQNAINKAWTTIDIDILLKHYVARISPDKSAPTLTQFVYYYADKVRYIT